jgi:4-aminobutyrate aminotransferase-like enzyme
MATKVKRKIVVGPDVDLNTEVVLLPDGTRLTNKLAAKMARDAIKQVRGRPSLTAVAVESPQLKVRVPVKLKKAIDKEAKRRGLTASMVVREALQERFSQKG